jgi:hypothetical protein
VSFDLAGNDLRIDQDPNPLPRRRRARPFDPDDPKTWHEVTDLQPRLKERLRLGAWIGWHVRKQGDREHWGDERRGDKRAGIIETVPAEVAVLDWTCVPTDTREHGVLWIELKSENGKLTELQAVSALRLAVAGEEVAILRPRHFLAPLGEPDTAFLRLVEHKPHAPGWGLTLVTCEMTLPEVMAL